MVTRENEDNYVSLPGMEIREQDEPLAKLPLWKLAAIALSFGVAQFSWSVQIGWVTPTLKSLGLPNQFVAYAYLAGPISGIIVQVIVGAWSDRSTNPWGRRRPFMMAGAAIAALSFIGFSNAEVMGELLGDKVGHRPWGIFFGILFFWTLDFSINSIQGPVRTLLADVAPAEQHSLGNTLFGVATGLGNAVGYFVGSVSDIKTHLGLSFMGTDLRVLYTISAIIMLVITTFTCLVVHEKRYNGGPRETVSWEGVVSTFKGIQVALYPVFAVQFCTWFACFTYFMFGTSWVGTNVNGGSADETSPLHQRYLDGVFIGNRALGVQSLVSFVYAIFLPLIMNVFGAKAAYFFSQAVQGAFLLSTMWWQDITGVYVIFSMLGVTYGTTQVIPWMLVTLSVSKSDKKGFYLAFMNLFQCFPEIMVSLLALPWFLAFHDNQTSILALGGGVALIGMVIVLFIPMNQIYGAADVDEPNTIFRRAGCIGSSAKATKSPSYHTFDVDEGTSENTP